ncbi:MAG: C-GCAxxG-C-C family protein [Atopobiaceae bacterium]|jgi:C_GCAxxG_C_C family probable redox protein|nr:C-GCAxxG-C-C family protein [Atopobiaceae bacterium]MCH4180118.1 C-GCAxxG-C-C family protein [Atopobiaceae bacterium]MCH4213830.1 C-GCAxxG-C-C family protein [Atopobiaceae bacterium]MCH4229932.1 C-GCAxxG-C-C family protein [Atopobiaceae bacterium]MCH4275707.1 C-GCAxxG-C-C family protein [Atopobiaceae bacterium]
MVPDTASERAAALHNAGYNCAQAVACSFADDLGVDERTIFRACEGLGLGMGGTACTCGAVSGACVAVGLATSDGDLDDPRTKRDSYALSRQVTERFGQRNGSTTCCELKGMTGGPMLRTCDGCVRDAAAIAAELLGSEVPGQDA